MPEQIDILPFPMTAHELEEKLHIICDAVGCWDWQVCHDPETIHDIIAEMRIGVNALAKYGAKPRKRDAWMVFLAMFADRIEAAYKREMGNAQKMREAAKYVQSTMERLRDPTDKNNAEFIRIWEIVSAALAAPPRNCDVGTADEQAQRFYWECHSYKRQPDECEASCPMIMSLNCALTWAQMPYKPTTEGHKRQNLLCA